MQVITCASEERHSDAGRTDGTHLVKAQASAYVAHRVSACRPRDASLSGCQGKFGVFRGWACQLHPNRRGRPGS